MEASSLLKAGSQQQLKSSRSHTEGCQSYGQLSYGPISINAENSNSHLYLSTQDKPSWGFQTIGDEFISKPLGNPLCEVLTGSWTSGFPQYVSQPEKGALKKAGVVPDGQHSYTATCESSIQDWRRTERGLSVVVLGLVFMPSEWRNQSFLYEDKPYRQVADSGQTFLSHTHLKKMLGSYTKQVPQVFPSNKATQTGQGFVTKVMQ